MKNSTLKSTIGDIPDLDKFVSQGNDNRSVSKTVPTVSPSAEPKEPTIVTTVRTPETTHQRLKVHCAMTRQSIQEFTLKAWETQLAAESKVTNL